jgi:hypothetical protein
VCPSVIMNPLEWGGPGPLGAVTPKKEQTINADCVIGQQAVTSSLKQKIIITIIINFSYIIGGCNVCVVDIGSSFNTNKGYVGLRRLWVL